MSTQQHDPLYQIFEEHLHSGLYDQLPVEQLVHDVVEFYIRSLSNHGHVPLTHIEFLRRDLFVDVGDMLKAKIYGHFDVSEYNRTRRKKTG